MSRELMAEGKPGKMLSWEECLKPRQWEELPLGDGILDMNDHREGPQKGDEDGEETGLDLI